MKFLIATLLGISASTSFADTVTIDFQTLEHNSISIASHGSSYTEDGFIVGHTNSNNPGGLFSWGTLANDYNGSTALINFSGGSATLKNNNESLFNLISIDLDSVNAVANYNFDVIFTGTKGDGSTLTQNFTGNTLTTFLFTDFTNLSKVVWLDNLNPHQFDNIVVNSADTVSSVPVPAAAWLFGSAMMGFIGFRRKA